MMLALSRRVGIEVEGGFACAWFMYSYITAGVKLGFFGRRRRRSLVISKVDSMEQAVVSAEGDDHELQRRLIARQMHPAVTQTRVYHVALERSICFSKPTQM